MSPPNELGEPIRSQPRPTPASRHTCMQCTDQPSSKLLCRLSSQTLPPELLVSTGASYSGTCRCTTLRMASPPQLSSCRSTCHTHSHSGSVARWPNTHTRRHRTKRLRPGPSIQKCSLSALAPDGDSWQICDSRRHTSAQRRGHCRSSRARRLAAICLATSASAGPRAWIMSRAPRRARKW